MFWFTIKEPCKSKLEHNQLYIARVKPTTVVWQITQPNLLRNLYTWSRCYKNSKFSIMIALLINVRILYWFCATPRRKKMKNFDYFRKWSYFMWDMSTSTLTLLLEMALTFPILFKLIYFYIFTEGIAFPNWQL